MKGNFQMVSEYISSSGGTKHYRFVFKNGEMIQVCIHSLDVEGRVHFAVNEYREWIRTWDTVFSGFEECEWEETLKEAIKLAQEYGENYGKK